MKASIKTHEGHAEKALKSDCFWLLRQIKSVTFQFDKSKNGILSLLDAQHSFLSCKQLSGQSADDYAECLVGWAETIKTHGGTVSANYQLVPEINGVGAVRSMDERKAMARKRTLAMALICSADASKVRDPHHQPCQSVRNGKGQVSHRHRCREGPSRCV